MIKQYDIGVFLDNNQVEAIYTIFSDGAGSLEIKGLEEGDYEKLVVSIPPTLPVDSYYSLLMQLFDILCINRVPYLLATRKLYIPYMPYGRADRAFSEGMCSARDTFINQFKWAFDEIITHDIHSEDSRVTNTPMNLKVNPPHEWTGLMSLLKSDFVVCAPDKGAYQRANKQAEAFGKGIITCTKQRDTSNGWITGYTVDNPELVKGNHILIIDDICDGGKTFEICAKSLRELGAKSVSLHVSHGIFSKGLDNFTGLLDHISCKFIVADYIGKEDLHKFNKLNGGIINGIIANR